VVGGAEARLGLSMWRVVLLTGVALLDGWLLLSFERHRRRHGTFGLSFFRKDNLAQNIQDAATLLGIALLSWQGVMAARPSADLPILIGTHEQLLECSRTIGAILLFGGVAFCLAAQADLGASWRIGVEDGDRSALVTSGLYRFSRNPVFLGLLAAFTGYALMLPTTLSFAILVGAYIGVRRQIAVEEKYLLLMHGDAYRDYARAVGRFLPVIGRMAAAPTR